MKKITKSMIKAYLENPDKCPFCQSEQIRYTGERDLPEGAEVQCEICARSWWEVFKITSIESYDVGITHN